MMTKEHETRLLKPLFLNSIPKSGTNLLIQALSGVPGLQHDPTDTFFDPDEYSTSFYRLGKIGNGHFAVGHIYYSQEWSRMLRRLQMKHIFVIRDLRDVLVSLCRFVIDKPEYHTMNQLRTYLLTHASTPIERMRLVMKGIQDDDFYYPDFHTWVIPFLGWMDDPNTYVVRYEDLVRTQGSKKQTLTSIVDYLVDGTWDVLKLRKTVERMEINIDPSYCGTFRKGIIGDWKANFQVSDEKAFNEIVGTTLREFGYMA